MPLMAQAQQSQRTRRIGVLMPFPKDNSEGQARIAAFLQELQQLGWIDGRNLQIEYRWETGDIRKAAMELVALSPDVILASTTPALAALQPVTRTVPIVFAQVADPVSAGFVANMAQPGAQHHRIYEYRIRYRCEMARTAQGNCAPRDAGRRHSRPCRNR